MKNRCKERESGGWRCSGYDGHEGGHFITPAQMKDGELNERARPCGPRPMRRG